MDRLGLNLNVIWRGVQTMGPYCINNIVVHQEPCSRSAFMVMGLMMIIYSVLCSIVVNVLYGAYCRP